MTDEELTKLIENGSRETDRKELDRLLNNPVWKPEHPAPARPELTYLEEMDLYDLYKEDVYYNK